MTEEYPGSTGRLLAVGLDSFDPAALEQGLASGDLPNIAAILAAGGRYTRLPLADGLVETAAWRSFTSGQPADRHGRYFLKLWNPASGAVEAYPPEREPLRPFWTCLQEAGKRLVLVDVPFAAPPPEAGFQGLYLSGWQGHYPAPGLSVPPPGFAELRGRIGAPVLAPERYGPPTAASLAALRDEALGSLGQLGDLAAAVLEREPADLVLLVAGGIHAAGHYLWDLSQLPGRERARAEALGLDQAMRAIHRAADELVGRLTGLAPDWPLLLFTPFGMGPNASWIDRLPRILRRLHGEAAPLAAGLKAPLARLRRSRLGYLADAALPDSLRAALARFWAPRSQDWTRTRFFALPSEGDGYIRINLAGRDTTGIVRPGADYERTLDGLEAALRGMTDLETGEPLVSRLWRTDAFVDAAAPGRAMLPDLVVYWTARRPHESVGVAIPGHGELRWPRGEGQSSGRSGNHRPVGWAITRGIGLAEARPVRRPRRSWCRPSSGRSACRCRSR
ncbi:MAG: alkaline phosphatase family protein [Geminicoccaceae bacterium]